VAKKAKVDNAADFDKKKKINNSSQVVQIRDLSRFLDIFHKFIKKIENQS
jgi:hypothetical protein